MPGVTLPHCSLPDQQRAAAFYFRLVLFSSTCSDTVLPQAGRNGTTRHALARCGIRTAPHLGLGLGQDLAIAEAGAEWKGTVPKTSPLYTGTRG